MAMRHNHNTMSEADFDAALGRTRLSDSSARAAKYVLVAGVSQVAAAERVGIKHRQQVSRAIGILKRAAVDRGRCAVCGGVVVGEEGAAAKT